MVHHGPEPVELGVPRFHRKQSVEKALVFVECPKRFSKEAQLLRGSPDALIGLRQRRQLLRASDAAQQCTCEFPTPRKLLPGLAITPEVLVDVAKRAPCA